MQPNNAKHHILPTLLLYTLCLLHNLPTLYIVYFLHPLNITSTLHSQNLLPILLFLPFLCNLYLLCPSTLCNTLYFLHLQHGLIALHHLYPTCSVFPIHYASYVSLHTPDLLNITYKCCTLYTLSSFLTPKLFYTLTYILYIIPYTVHTPTHIYHTCCSTHLTCFTYCQGHSTPSVPSAKVAIVGIANYPRKG